MTNKLTEDELKEAARLVERVYERSLAGCCWHIVLDDGNLTDDCVASCRSWAALAEHPACIALGPLVERMSKTQRAKLGSGGYKKLLGTDHPLYKDIMTKKTEFEKAAEEVNERVRAADGIVPKDLPRASRALVSFTMRLTLVYAGLEKDEDLYVSLNKTSQEEKWTYVVSLRKGDDEGLSISGDSDGPWPANKLVKMANQFRPGLLPPGFPLEDE